MEALATLDTGLGPLAVVRATAEDMEAVHDLLRDAAERARALGYAQWAWVFEERAAPYIRQRIEGGGVYLAQLGGATVGVIRLQWDDPAIWDAEGLDGRAGYIHMFAVRRSAAGHGVGRALLAWAEGVIAAHGREFARLDTTADNPRLCAYYEGLGYRKRGVKETAQWRNRRYEKRLLGKRDSGFGIQVAG